MKKNVLLIICFWSIIGTGCVYHKEEELYPVPCNNTNVTYSATISRLLSTYACTTCHSGPAPSGNFSLVGYNNVKAKVLDRRLLGAISHASGFSPMPQGGQKMTDCEISKVKKWIDAGAPDN
jgi:hypothetical protein